MSDWYRSVPSHWRRARVKSVAERVTDGAHISPDTENGVYDFVSTRDVKGGTINFAGSLKTTQETYDYMVKTGCRPSRGDVLFSKDGTVGETAIVAEEHDFVVASSLVIITPQLSLMTPSYLVYMFASKPAQEQAASFMRGAGLPRLSVGNLARLEVLVPPLDEQRAIANYLDREIARIDTLIKEQQLLIEMLRERRQALIDVAFSALGESRVQLRRYTRFLTSGSRGWGDYYADEGERFVRIGNLPRGSLDLRGDVQFVDLPSDVTEGSRTMLEAGDLLFSITAYLGSVAVVGDDWVGAYVSQHVALCRLESEALDSRFVGWFMLTTTGQDQLNEGAAGGAKMQLALDDIRGLRVPLAPITEQRSVAASLDEQTAKIDTLIAETERFIEFSRERRSALITAVVTGQIDVREVA